MKSLSTNALKELFQLELSLPNPQKEDFLSLSQRHFLRKAKKERYSLHNTIRQYLKKKEYYSIFDKLHLMEEIAPESSTYDGFIILGTTYKDFKRRLKHFLSLNLDGPIFLLAGERALSKRERLQTSLNLATEDAMIQMCANNMLPTTASWNLLMTPQKTTNRPTTEDTFHTFLHASPPQGKYLIVSSQPFAEYQHLVANRVLKEEKSSLEFDITAPASEKGLAIPIYLDTTSRILYEYDISTSS